MHCLHWCVFSSHCHCHHSASLSLILTRQVNVYHCDCRRHWLGWLDRKAGIARLTLMESSLTFFACLPSQPSQLTRCFANREEKISETKCRQLCLCVCEQLTLLLLRNWGLVHWGVHTKGSRASRQASEAPICKCVDSDSNCDANTEKMPTWKKGWLKISS